MSGVKIEGLKELGDAFNLAPQLLERRVMANATRAGGNVFRRGIEETAPVRSGELKRNISVKFKTIAGRGISTAVIGVIYRGKRALTGRHGKAPSTEDPGVYVRFLEFGTRFMRAFGFMRKTFDAKSTEALNAFADKMRSQLGDLVK